MDIDPKTREAARALVEEYRQRKIKEFFEDLNTGNYYEKMQQWERIKHTI